jgi:peptidoglycan/LPS O-acetylase OafA/YrhL
MVEKLAVERIPKKENTHRSLGLDSLRSLSIVIVLANHGFIGFFLSNGLIQFDGLVAKISASSVISIEWLFILSGYLIGTMMIRSFESNRTWWACARDFWLRRWFRTLPNYYLFLLLNLVLVSWGWMEGVYEWKFWIFSQNLAWREVSPLFFGESWSLALDEWFYFLMPLLLGLAALVGKFELRTRFLIAGGLLIFLPSIARVFLSPMTDFFAWDASVRRITIYHLDATGWGVLAAVMNRWHKSWWRSHESRKAAVGVMLMLAGLSGVWAMTEVGGLLPHLGQFWNVAAISLMGSGTFMIMPWLTQSFNPRPRLAALTGKMSMYAYSIYLCHFPLMLSIVHWLHQWPSAPNWVLPLAVVMWLLSVLGVAILTYHGFEGPVAQLRERFTRKIDASPF